MALVLLGQILGGIACIWSYVLCFTVNDATSAKVISFVFTLVLPVIGQLGWAWWAFVHHDPYIWIVIATAAAWGLGFLLMAISANKSE